MQLQLLWCYLFDASWRVRVQSRNFDLALNSMSDAEMDETNGLFFAGSDEDGKTQLFSSQSNSAIVQTPPHSSPPPRLFLPGSDDENEFTIPDTLRKRKLEETDTMDFDVFGIDLPRPPSTSSLSEHLSMRSSSPPLQPSAGPSRLPEDPTKKQKWPIESVENVRSPAALEGSAYIGEVLVPNAFSNVSGKGYVQINDPILVKREDESDAENVPSKPTAPGKKGGKKQLTLKAMMPPKSLKSVKKRKIDNIVRLHNTRGFGWWLLGIYQCIKTDVK